MGHAMDSGESRQLNCHSFSKRTLTVKKFCTENHEIVEKNMNIQGYSEKF